MRTESPWTVSKSENPLDPVRSAGRGVADDELLTRCRAVFKSLPIPRDTRRYKRVTDLFLHFVERSLCIPTTRLTILSYFYAVFHTPHRDNENIPSDTNVISMPKLLPASLTARGSPVAQDETKRDVASRRRMRRDQNV